jgi:hypothetical protein
MLPRVEAGVQRIVVLPHHVAGAGAHLASDGLHMQASLVPYDAISAIAPRGEQALVFVMMRLDHN